MTRLRLLLLAAVILLLWLMSGQRLPLPTLPEPPPVVLQGKVDRILVEKSARKMSVFRDGQPLKTYRIALGFSPEGDKVRQGDGKTPEGTFRINRRNPRSSYHLSLGLDYPQPGDVKRARAGGYSPGGDIMIHGQPNGRAGTLRNDWTAGCIAVSNAEIEELWRAVDIGTEVVVRR